MTQLFSDLREIAHALVPIIGALGMATGLIAVALGTVGVHVTDEQTAAALAGIGAVVTLLSKLIDSVNNAVITKATVASASTPLSPVMSFSTGTTGTPTVSTVTSTTGTGTATG